MSHTTSFSFPSFLESWNHLFAPSIAIIPDSTCCPSPVTNFPSPCPTPEAPSPPTIPLPSPAVLALPRPPSQPPSSGFRRFIAALSPDASLVHPNLPHSKLPLDVNMPLRLSHFLPLLVPLVQETRRLPMPPLLCRARLREQSTSAPLHGRATPPQAPRSRIILSMPPSTQAR